VNTIAVQLNNTAQDGWDDVAFDISLRTITRTAQPIAMNVLQGSPSNPGATAGVGNPTQIGLNITIPPNTIWRVESADNIGGPWQLVDIVSNTQASPVYLPDIGQNGRAPTANTAMRFYRLRPN